MTKLPRTRQTREASPAPQNAKPVGAAARSASLQHLAPGAIVQRAMAAPRSLRPAELLAMQRTIGNRAVGAMLGRAPVQAKPIVNAPGDQYEREADRVAEAVLHMPPTPREETPGQQVSTEIMPKPDAIKSGDGSFAAGEDFTRRLQASQRQGRPLPPPLRQTFETNFGADFSGVRIHSGEQASQLSHDIQAQAFTHGSDIFLGAGDYAPGTVAGKRLLAHELTHVVQQGAAPSKAATGADQVTRAAAAAPGAGARRIQRLNWQEGTEWNKATRVGVSKYGSIGCLLVEDNTADDPVIVKSGENMPAETMLATNIHPATSKAPGFGGSIFGADVPITTPGVRIPLATERNEISAKLNELMTPILQFDINPYWRDAEQLVSDKLTTARQKAKKQLEGIKGPGTLVFEYAQGTDFKVVAGKDYENLPSLFNQKDFVVALGNLTAIDIFMGNWDRIIGFNLGNFRVSTKGDKINKIALIDNAAPLAGASFKSFIKYPIYGKGGKPENQKIKPRTITGKDEFKVWSDPEEFIYTEHLQTDKFEALANHVITKIRENNNITNEKDIQKWLVAGLKAGKDRLRKLTMEDMVAGMEKIETITDEDRNEIRQSIRDRYQFIFKSPIQEQSTTTTTATTTSTPTAITTPTTSTSPSSAATAATSLGLPSGGVPVLPRAPIVRDRYRYIFDAQVSEPGTTAAKTAPPTTSAQSVVPPRPLPSSSARPVEVLWRKRREILGFLEYADDKAALLVELRAVDQDLKNLGQNPGLSPFG